MSRLRTAAVALALSALAACGDDDPVSGTDAGTADAAVSDAGARDAGDATDAARDADIGADAGGDPLEACFAGYTGLDGPFLETRLFQTADRRIRIRFAVEPGTRPYAGETWPFDLMRFAIERDGVAECLTMASALAYDFGHHNWMEVATATGAATYIVRSDLDVETWTWANTLTIDGGAPIALEFVDCFSEPMGNGCAQRPATP